MGYFLRQNKWTASQEGVLTKSSIQGWSVIEVRWREIVYDIVARPDKSQMIAYDQAVNSAMMGGLPSPPDPVSDPQGYQMWMEQARMGNPSMPSLAPGPKQVVQYRGPWFQRNSDFDYYFDPNTEDWTAHELFPASSLTLPDRKRLEVARALATRPRLLLLDEVMAGLRPTETEAMVAAFRSLGGERGITILLIEHVMRAVMALAQRVYVLHHGEIIASGAPQDVTRDERVLSSYLGSAAVGGAAG